MMSFTNKNSISLSSKRIKIIFIIPLLLNINISHSFNNTVTDNENYEAQANIYPASFFTQYQPQSAMDMVARIPGFSFNHGSNARGFGGNSGNVLIDGARPTAKSGGLEGALKRISAAQVKMIEIIRGGAGEAAGHSVVANVIRDKNITTGSWASKFRIAPDGKVMPNIEAAVTTNMNDWDISVDIDIGGRPNSRTAVIEDLNAENELTSSSA